MFTKDHQQEKETGGAELLGSASPGFGALGERMLSAREAGALAHVHRVLRLLWELPSVPLLSVEPVRCSWELLQRLCHCSVPRVSEVERMKRFNLLI